jgi:uncharacterized radical SAM superfamily Fe-S cluster-containing enzyme
VQVRYLSQNNQVFLERHCPEHGLSKALVAEDLNWYLKALRSPVAASPPPKTIKKERGCPHSCGPCSFHAQRCNLPVFSITNACNLRCPICFTYNRKDRQYFMSSDEFKRHIDFVIEATGTVDLVNITGGEPTLHPQLFSLLELARRPEIGRITMNTNGLEIAQKPEIAQRLADSGVYAVLSLDTLDHDKSIRIHGRDIVREKLQALEQLGAHNVQTTLLMVLIGGVNEDELGHLVDLTFKHDFVRSLTIQTMAYTGQGGGFFSPRKHIPVDGVERRIAEATGQRIRMDHFVPMPTAHPLCYGVCYMLFDETGKKFSITDILEPEALATHLSSGYFLRPSNRFEEDLREAINRLWSEGGNEELLFILKKLLKTLYPVGEILSPAARQQRAEQMIKTIYVHSHMDEDTFEIGRAIRCPDQVPVNAEKLIGACNYNLFYRMKDSRFWKD